MSYFDKFLQERLSLVSQIAQLKSDVFQRDGLIDALSFQIQQDQEKIKLSAVSRIRLEFDLSSLREELRLRNQDISMLQQQLSHERALTDHQLHDVTKSVSSQLCQLVRSRDDALDLAAALVAACRHGS
jgi:hypothetical protein